MSAEVINAIAGLWKLAFVGLLATATVIFRKQLRALFDRLSRFSGKWGAAEIAVDSAPPAASIEAIHAVAVSAEPPAIEQEKPKELEAPQPPGSAFSKMTDALFTHHFEVAQSAFEEWKGEESDPDKKLRGEIFYYALRFAEGASKSMKRLEEIAATRDELRAYAKGWEGWAYRRLGALEQARDAYISASAASRGAEEQSDYTVALAELARESGDGKGAVAMLLGALSGTGASKLAKLRLYKALANEYEQDGQKLRRVIALERALELAPSDNDIRFAAGYAASEAKLGYVATSNYNTLAEQDPKNSTATNNLAVQVDAFKLPIEAVRLYEKAAEEGNTLASANLAYKLLGEGFIVEATRRLNVAKEQKDPHPNVNEAAAECVKRTETEHTRLKEILKSGARQKLFLHAFAEATFETSAQISAFTGYWKGPYGGPFEANVSAGRVTVIWATSDSKKKFAGRQTNRGLEGTIYGWNAPGSLFGGAEGSFAVYGEDALAYLSADGKRLEIGVLEADPLEIWSFARADAPIAPGQGAAV
jgi:tetratricopeptide (TPR) repeat protein